MPRNELPLRLWDEGAMHNSFIDFEDTMVNLLLKPDFMRRLAGTLARLTERGYILCVSGITQDLSLEDWDSWRAVFTRSISPAGVPLPLTIRSTTTKLTIS